MDRWFGLRPARRTTKSWTTETSAPVRKRAATHTQAGQHPVTVAWDASVRAACTSTSDVSKVVRPALTPMQALTATSTQRATASKQLVALALCQRLHSVAPIRKKSAACEPTMLTTNRHWGIGLGCTHGAHLAVQASTTRTLVESIREPQHLSRCHLRVVTAAPLVVTGVISHH